MHEGLPICYVKPTILCIDDEVSITDTLDGLISQQYTTVCFNKTIELLDYIKNYESIFSQNKLFREFTESEYSDSTSSLIQFNFKNINDIIESPNINKEIALILVDNTMPDMNGLLFCEKLKEYPFEKILYTGTDDYKSGILAMNSHIIGNFINKSCSPEMLMDKIEEFTFHYFYDKTFTLKQHLEIDELLPLSDKSFVVYFKQLLKDKNIIKYCLIDKNGSISMINNNSKKSTLIVHTDKSLNGFLKLIVEEQELCEVYDLVSKRQKIPYIDHSKSNIDLKSIKLYVPDILMGKKNYYIHFLEE